MAISAEQCLAHLNDALRRYPENSYSPDAMEWFAEVLGTVRAYNAIASMPFEIGISIITKMNGISTTHTNSRAAACAEFRAKAQALAWELKLSTNSFTAAHIAAGQAHDYFEEVRGIIEIASKDILFCDPYLNADFIQRYGPFLKDGCELRLLSSAQYAAQLAASCMVYRQQYKRTVLTRVVPDKALHDRHLVVDGARVWQSGASFKDGPKNAATSINEIIDTAVPLIRALEGSWNSATVIA